MFTLYKKFAAVVALSASLLGASAPVLAQQAATAEALIQNISTEVIDTIKGDKAIQGGDIGKILTLVDTKVMPNVDFQRMTSSAVGRYWREATPEQKTRLQDEFKILLVRTYSGALTQVKDQTVSLKPSRSQPTDTEVVVRTEVKGKGDPIQLDYRVEKVDSGWKIYDVNVLGVWLVDQYRGSFAQEIGAKGIDGLISTLAERNKAAAGKKLMLLMPETLTLNEAVDTLRLFDQTLRHDTTGDTLTVDASGLKRFDSSALAVLLECERMAQSFGKRFNVHSPPAQLVKLAELYGIDSLVLA